MIKRLLLSLLYALSFSFYLFFSLLLSANKSFAGRSYLASSSSCRYMNIPEKIRKKEYFFIYISSCLFFLSFLSVIFHFFSFFLSFYFIFLILFHFFSLFPFCFILFYLFFWEDRYSFNGSSEDQRTRRVALAVNIVLFNYSLKDRCFITCLCLLARACWQDKRLPQDCRQELSTARRGERGWAEGGREK